MRDSHGHEAGGPSLRVRVLVFQESDGVVSDLDDSQLMLPHRYERICEEAIEELAEVVQLVSDVRQHVQVRAVISSAVALSALEIKEAY